MLCIKRAALLLVLTLAAGCNGTLLNSGSTPATPTPAPQTLIVPDRNTATILQFSTTANGNVAPSVTIAGAATTLVGPYAVARDSSGKTYVADADGQAVDVFAAGATGNTAPAARIAGSNTTISIPSGIGVDSAGNIYVENSGGNTVTVFAASANGNVAPTRTISGSNTLFACPQSLVVGSAGDFYTVNSNCGAQGNSVLYFAAGANGNIAPTRNITGAATTLSNPIGVSLDSAGNLYVMNTGNSSLTVFAAGATGNVAPIRTIAGSSTTLGSVSSRGIAVDAAGNAYVTGSPCNLAVPAQVAVFAAAASGNVAPVRTITGSSTTMNCPVVPFIF